MKNLVLFIAVSIFLSSCSEKEIKLSSIELESLNPFGIPDSSVIKNSYLVFLNHEKFKPIIDEFPSDSSKENPDIFEKAAMAKINTIVDFGKQYGLDLKAEQIFVEAASGFIFEDSSETIIKKIISEKGQGNIDDVQADFYFYLQNPRARMQNGGGALPQTIRARMQENPQWGYNVKGYTSDAVLYLGGGQLSDTSNASDAKVWLIDSGIDSNHQDLLGLVNMRLSKSYVDGSPGNDKWGHGTAMAGLIAAIPANINFPEDPTLIGMTGVSPGAELVSLKVFGEFAEARYSHIIQALNLIIRRRGEPGDIINLSLGNKVRNCYQYGLYPIIRRMARGGFLFSIAAGNAFDGNSPVSASQYLPACAEGENIFTIGSFKIDYPTGSTEYSYFSNFGSPPIDWVVPGSYIFTTYPENNKYAVMEGTSLSAGLMSGLLHLTQGNLNTKTSIVDSLGTSYPVPER
ncbi:hypothetical protein Aoki45_08070 [Algoriphagus sp. oki45]|uniref:S8 family peptidase n=1 Tax=Algoriphagus sp. oki45 TaxID=3067294 RepID=UPI0027E8DBF6|nr:hypothetical protein Aoki45_08070 [Algoriphagus sp. oki45]